MRWRPDGGVAGEVLAGVTLAAVAIPQSLAYAKIAGMPTVTGLYTLLLPMAVFALLGSARHLVVASDSATAVILAASLTRLAAPASAQYTRLAGLAALLTGGLLLLARLARLGFLANFLSRTVLLGFLTGVGVQVAIAQLPELLGINAPGTGSLSRIVHTVAALPRAHLATVVVSVAVILVILTARRIARGFPGVLIAVAGAIVVSWTVGLARRGVAVTGPVPHGPPPLAPPAVDVHDARLLLAPAASMFLVIVAQSAATARAYAAEAGETLSADVGLIGLGVANTAAAFSGTFVVNGSPTLTQAAGDAGSRSRLAQLTASAVALAVVVFAARPLAYLPTAALAAIVFLIAAGLVDIRGMRRLFSVRRPEFGIALLTAAAVLVLGVQDGIVLAVTASIIDHVRHTYRPVNSVLIKSPAGHWQATQVRPGARTTEGLVVYRFGTSLYYANSARLLEDVAALTGSGPPLRWMVLDGAAIGDIDYTAASALSHLVAELQKRHIRLVITSLTRPVRRQLDRYGISDAIGADGFYDTPGAALEAFRAASRTADGGASLRSASGRG